MTIMKKFKKLVNEPIAIHIGFCLLTGVYVAIGALIFTLLEGSNEDEGEFYMIPDVTPNVTDCLTNYLQSHDVVTDDTSSEIANCFRIPVLMPDWHFESSVLFAFTILTTIGYGHVVPTSTYGRIFFILYAVVGIPLNLVNLANIGAYIVEGVEWFNKKLRLLWADYCARDKEKARRKEKFTQTGFFFTVAFLLYILFGALMIPLYEQLGGGSFVGAFYFCFVTLTTIGLGDIFPQRDGIYMAISLFYIGCGLALTTISLDVLQTNFKKLHHVNQDLKEEDIENAEVWFGGEKMTVGDLMDMYSNKLGIPPPSPEEMKKMIDSKIKGDRDMDNGDTELSSIHIEKPEPDGTPYWFDRRSPSRPPPPAVGLAGQQQPEKPEPEQRKNQKSSFADGVHQAFEELRPLEDYESPQQHTVVPEIRHSPLSSVSEFDPRVQDQKRFSLAWIPETPIEQMPLEQVEQLQIQNQLPEPFIAEVQRIPVQRWPKAEQLSVAMQHVEAATIPSPTTSHSPTLMPPTTKLRKISAPPDVSYEQLMKSSPLPTISESNTEKLPDIEEETVKLQTDLLDQLPEEFFRVQPAFAHEKPLPYSQPILLDIPSMDKPIMPMSFPVQDEPVFVEAPQTKLISSVESDTTASLPIPSEFFDAKEAVEPEPITLSTATPHVEFAQLEEVPLELDAQLEPLLAQPSPLQQADDANVQPESLYSKVLGWFKPKPKERQYNHVSKFLQPMVQEVDLDECELLDDQPVGYAARTQEPTKRYDFVQRFRDTDGEVIRPQVKLIPLNERARKLPGRQRAKELKEAFENLPTKMLQKRKSKQTPQDQTSTFPAEVAVRQMYHDNDELPITEWVERAADGSSEILPVMNTSNYENMFEEEAKGKPMKDKQQSSSRVSLPFVAVLPMLEGRTSRGSGSEILTEPNNVSRDYPTISEDMDFPTISEAQPTAMAAENGSFAIPQIISEPETEPLLQKHTPETQKHQAVNEPKSWYGKLADWFKPKQHVIEEIPDSVDHQPAYAENGMEGFEELEDRPFEWAAELQQPIQTDAYEFAYSTRDPDSKIIRPQVQVKPTAERLFPSQPGIIKKLSQQFEHGPSTEGTTAHKKTAKVHGHIVHGHDDDDKHSWAPVTNRKHKKQPRMSVVAGLEMGMFDALVPLDHDKTLVINEQTFLPEEEETEVDVPAIEFLQENQPGSKQTEELKELLEQFPELSETMGVSHGHIEDDYPYANTQDAMEKGTFSQPAFAQQLTVPHATDSYPYAAKSDTMKGTMSPQSALVQQIAVPYGQSEDSYPYSSTSDNMLETTIPKPSFANQMAFPHGHATGSVPYSGASDTIEETTIPKPSFANQMAFPHGHATGSVPYSGASDTIEETTIPKPSFANQMAFPHGHATGSVPYSGASDTMKETMIPRQILAQNFKEAGLQFGLHPSTYDSQTEENRFEIEYPEERIVPIKLVDDKSSKQQDNVVQDMEGLGIPATDYCKGGLAKPSSYHVTSAKPEQELTTQVDLVQDLLGVDSPNRLSKETNIPIINLEERNIFPKTGFAAGESHDTGNQQKRSKPPWRVTEETAEPGFGSSQEHSEVEEQLFEPYGVAEEVLPVKEGLFQRIFRGSQKKDEDDSSIAIPGLHEKPIQHNIDEEVQPDHDFYFETAVGRDGQTPERLGEQLTSRQEKPKVFDSEFAHSYGDEMSKSNFEDPRMAQSKIDIGEAQQKNDESESVTINLSERSGVPRQGSETSTLKTSTSPMQTRGQNAEKLEDLAEPVKLDSRRGDTSFDAICKLGSIDTRTEMPDETYSRAEAETNELAEEEPSFEPTEKVSFKMGDTVIKVPEEGDEDVYMEEYNSDATPLETSDIDSVQKLEGGEYAEWKPAPVGGLAEYSSESKDSDDSDILPEMVCELPSLEEEEEGEEGEDEEAEDEEGQELQSHLQSTSERQAKRKGKLVRQEAKDSPRDLDDVDEEVTDNEQIELNLETRSPEEQTAEEQALDQEEPMDAPDAKQDEDGIDYNTVDAIEDEEDAGTEIIFQLLLMFNKLEDHAENIDPDDPANTEIDKRFLNMLQMFKGLERQSHAALMFSKLSPEKKRSQFFSKLLATFRNLENKTVGALSRRGSVPAGHSKLFEERLRLFKEEEQKPHNSRARWAKLAKTINSGQLKGQIGANALAERASRMIRQQSLPDKPDQMPTDKSKPSYHAYKPLQHVYPKPKPRTSSRVNSDPAEPGKKQAVRKIGRIETGPFERIESDPSLSGGLPKWKKGKGLKFSTRRPTLRRPQSYYEMTKQEKKEFEPDAEFSRCDKASRPEGIKRQQSWIQSLVGYGSKPKASEKKKSETDPSTSSKVSDTKKRDSSQFHQLAFRRLSRGLETMKSKRKRKFKTNAMMFREMEKGGEPPPRKSAVGERPMPSVSVALRRLDWEKPKSKPEEHHAQKPRKRSQTFEELVHRFSGYNPPPSSSAQRAPQPQQKQSNVFQNLISLFNEMEEGTKPNKRSIYS